jgi:hypothetical protein
MKRIKRLTFRVNQPKKPGLFVSTLCIFYMHKDKPELGGGNSIIKQTPDSMF